jgi:MOSC domain-containing protein YiiM
MSESKDNLSGRVAGIYITPNKGQPTISMEQVHAIPGKGIEGDRYFNLTVNPKGQPDPGRQITLFEMEVVEFLQENEGIPIKPEQTRRNIATRGIALNQLVGRDFYVGDIHLRGVRLCEPCQYLADLTDTRVLSAMVHQGGLRADILSEGIIHLNDRITIPG